MNRTQRAIKKQYRQGENEAKRLKQKSVEMMKNSTTRAGSLFDRKGNAAHNVKAYAKNEKEQRELTHDYKKRVLSEKKTNKEAVRV